MCFRYFFFFFFSSRRRHTRCSRDWSSDVCSSDLGDEEHGGFEVAPQADEQILHVEADSRIERAERLVHEDDLGLENRSEEHTSELQSRLHLVCRLLLEKKKKKKRARQTLYPPGTPTHQLTRRLHAT